MRSGSVDIVLGGVTYSLRPSYGAMRDIEARTGMTIQELLELVVVQRLKIEEAVLIIWYACNASGDSFDSLDAVGRVVFDERVTSEHLRSSISKFLLNCLYAPKEALEKWDAEVAPTILSAATG